MFGENNQPLLLGTIKEGGVDRTSLSLRGGLVRLPAARCLALGPFLGCGLTRTMVPWGLGLLLGPWDLVIVLSAQELLRVVILVLSHMAMADLQVPCQESSQQSQGKEGEVRSTHGLAGWGRQGG